MARTCRSADWNGAFCEGGPRMIEVSHLSGPAWCTRSSSVREESPGGQRLCSQTEGSTLAPYARQEPQAGAQNLEPVAGGPPPLVLPQDSAGEMQSLQNPILPGHTRPLVDDDCLAPALSLSPGSTGSGCPPTGPRIGRRREEAGGAGQKPPPAQEAPSTGEKQEAQALGGAGPHPSPLLPLLGPLGLGAAATPSPRVSQAGCSRGSCTSKGPSPLGMDGAPNPETASSRPYRWGSMPLAHWQEQMKQHPTQGRLLGPQPEQGQGQGHGQGQGQWPWQGEGEGRASGVGGSGRGPLGLGALSSHESILRRASSLPQCAEADSAGVLVAFTGALQSLQDVRMREEKLERAGVGLDATCGTPRSHASAEQGQVPGAASWAGQGRQLSAGGPAGGGPWIAREFPPGTRLARGRSAAWFGDWGTGNPPGADADTGRVSLRRQASAAAALASAMGVAAAPPLVPTALGLASAMGVAAAAPLVPTALGVASAPKAACHHLGAPCPRTTSSFLSPSSPPRQPTGADTRALTMEHPLGGPGAHRAMGGLPRPVRTISLSLDHPAAASRDHPAAASREAATSRDAGHAQAGKEGAARGVESSVALRRGGPGMDPAPKESFSKGKAAHSGVPVDTRVPNPCAVGALTSHRGANHGAFLQGVFNPEVSNSSSALQTLPGPTEPPVVLCQWCSHKLFVPSKLPPPRKGVQKLRCGSCFRICRYVAGSPGPPAEHREQPLLSAHLSSGASSASSRPGGASEESYAAAEQLIPWRSISRRTSSTSSAGNTNSTGTSSAGSANSTGISTRSNTSRASTDSAAMPQCPGAAVANQEGKDIPTAAVEDHADATVPGHLG